MGILGAHMGAIGCTGLTKGISAQPKDTLGGAKGQCPSEKTYMARTLLTLQLQSMTACLYNVTAATYSRRPVTHKVK